MYRTIEEPEKKPFKEVVLLRPFVMLFTKPTMIFMTVCMCLATLVLSVQICHSYTRPSYLLFFAFPIAFGEIRHLSLGITGTTFVSIMIGIVSAFCPIPAQEMVYKRLTTHGDCPEARLFSYDAWGSV